jgi:hypothetical protein
MIIKEKMKIFYILTGVLFLTVSFADGFCGASNDQIFLFPRVESHGILIKKPVKANLENCAESKG